ncbi:MAG: RICIN domain-containing protein, partial [Polyangia bacterium]
MKRLNWTATFLIGSLLSVTACTAPGQTPAAEPPADTSTLDQPHELVTLILFATAIVLDTIEQIKKASEEEKWQAIKQKMSDIAAHFHDLQAKVEQAKETAQRIEDAIVREDNVKIWEKIAAALNDADSGRTALGDLANDRSNGSIQANVEFFSTESLVPFLSDDTVFSEVGPQANQQHFTHLLAYPAFAAGIAVRTAALVAQNDKATLRTRYAGEFNNLANRLLWVVAQIRQNAYCDAVPAAGGTWDNPWCGAKITCHDLIRKTPDVVTFQQTTCIGGGTFDPNFFTATPAQNLQNDLGAQSISDLAAKLQNMARWGQPDDPVPEFGALHIALRRDTNAVDGTDPTDGARPQLKAWSETAPTMRWVQEPDGTLRNEVTGQCLEVYGWSQDNGAAITTWSCHGGANQRWQQING